VHKSRSPLRVAFLTHEPFYPPSGGGSAEAVYLVEELVRRNHEIHIFCPRIAEPDAVEKKFRVHLHQFTTWKMGRYTRLRNFKYLLYPFFLQRMVADAARSIQFDLLLSQHSIAGVAAGRLKLQLRLPVVMNFPDFLTGFMETWPAHLAPRPLIEFLKHFEIFMPARYGVDGVCTVSDELADYIVKCGYPRERTLPIYYGYAAEHFPFREKMPVANRPPVVVMHGSLDFHHLGEIALGAVQHVTQARPDAVFRFIGQQTSALKKFLYRARQTPNFRFECPGFVPYEEVAKHLADATVGMVPYEESAGTHCAFVAKVVEYVATGLPVACTPLKSIQRYFQNDPMVRFSKFDGVDLGNKIVSWLEESPALWHSRALESAGRVKKELDWQPVCCKAIDFVEDIYARSIHYD